MRAPVPATDEKTPSTAVLVVAYRAAEKLELCLQSVAEYLPDLQVFVWDNSGSGYTEVRRLAEMMPNINWHLSDENIGFAAAVNRLADTVPGRDLLLLNPDAELTGSLTLTLNALRKQQVAAAAPMLGDELATRRTVPARFSRARRPWDVAHRKLTLLNLLCSAGGLAERLRGTFVSHLYYSPPSSVDGYLTGACLAIRRAAWDAVGPFDEDYFLYCEEVDWQERALSAGWRIELTDEVGFRHSAAGTVSDDSMASTRSDDLLRASLATLIERRHGTFVAEFYLAAVCAIEMMKQLLRRGQRSFPQRNIDFVMTIQGPDTDVDKGRVRHAVMLNAQGYSVALVSLRKIGALPRVIPSSVRLVRRPWWWPAISPRQTPSILVTGKSMREQSFALLSRIRWNPIWLRHDEPIEELVRVAKEQATLATATEGGR